MATPVDARAGKVDIGGGADGDVALEHTAPAFVPTAVGGTRVSSLAGAAAGLAAMGPVDALQDTAALAATQAAPQIAVASSDQLGVQISRPSVPAVGSGSEDGGGDLPPVGSVPGYRLVRSLGRGAFGAVWLAEQENTGKLVAIKFYSHAEGLDFTFLKREVEKLAALYTSREIVQLLEVGWDASPPYYVMEYLEQGSLEDRLRKGPLPEADALRILRAVARALAQAHNIGILHCDLKPANVLLDADLRPRLCDFGQSRLTSEQRPSLGTFFYMAPEQADLHALPDARWDVYALGAMLYAMLSGSAPYRTPDARKLLSGNATLIERLRLYRELLHQAPSPVEELRRQRVRIDAPLRELLSDCLSLDPEARPGSAQAVLDALKSREARRARRPVLIIGVVGLVLLMGMVTLIGRQTLRTALGTSQQAIIGRALESTRFAARFVAETAGREVERRWGALEAAASDPTMRDVLLELGQGPTADPADAAASEYEARRRNALQTVLQEWLERRSQTAAALGATSWFLTDSSGWQWARVPMSPTVGQNWAFRDYFHGHGADLPKPAPGAPPVQIAPIRRPHRSAVFDSHASGHRIVAFSVPVWSEPSDASPPQVVGVLGMTVQLGRFGELNPGERKGTRQVTALFDSRQDRPGQRGLILQHPRLAQYVGQAASGAQPLPPPQLRIDPRHLQRLDAARAASARGDGDARAAQLLTFVGYVDPLGEAAGDWLAAMEPVMVRGQDTGWVVIVQEPYEDVIRPVYDLGMNLLRIGVIGGIGLLALLTGLWWLLLRAVGTDPRPRVRRRDGAASPAAPG